MVVICGDNFDNFLVGGIDDDSLCGLGGDDILSGFAGNDTLYHFFKDVIEIKNVKSTTIR